MSFNKSVQKMFFMLAISVSAILLCFVGVWATVQMNLNFQGKVSPDIRCIITANGKEIFDNYSSTTTGNPTTNGNTLSTSVELTGGVTTAVTFNITNYTAGKYIRLSVADISGATIENNAVAVCANTSGANSSMTIHIAGATNTNAVIALNVEEVYMVTVSGTGLGVGEGPHYFAPDEACEIAIAPQVGYQLPTSITVGGVENTSYTHTNTGATISAQSILKTNATIVANCNQIFEIKKSTAKSLGTPNQNNNNATFTIKDNTTYFPNNGHYTYNNGSTTQGTLKSTFVEYPYYVEMGMYPQTEYDSAPSGTYTKVGDKYYLHELIKWIVVGTQDDTPLSSLYYKNNMLYTDGACGKPYTGQLVLMSAYILDSSAFYANGTTMQFEGSTVENHLKNNLAKSLTGTNGITLENAASQTGNHTQGQYLKAQTLTSVTATYSNNEDSFIVDHDYTSTFFLPGGTKILNSSATNENFVVDSYFNTEGILETQDQKTFNIGVTSSTAYALAKGVEENTLTTLSGEESATASRGWVLANDNTDTSTSAYWTRSGGGHNGAIAINMHAIPKNVLVSNENVGIRPMMVLDLGFYHTDTYEA